MAKAMEAITEVQDIPAGRTGAIAGDPSGPAMTASHSVGLGWGTRI